MVFERIDMFNEEIEAAREADTQAHSTRRCPRGGRVRRAHRHRSTGSTQVLRVFLNHQWKQAGQRAFNPVYAVETGARRRGHAAPCGIRSRSLTSWTSPTDDRLALPLAVSCCCASSTSAAGSAGSPTSTSTAPRLRSRSTSRSSRSGGKTRLGTAPSRRPGERVVGLDKGSVAGREGTPDTAQARAPGGRGGVGELRPVCANKLGEPLRPITSSRRFRGGYAAEAGLPVIKFHAARHTAATLGNPAELHLMHHGRGLGRSRDRGVSWFLGRRSGAPLG